MGASEQRESRDGTQSLTGPSDTGPVTYGYDDAFRATALVLSVGGERLAGRTVAPRRDAEGCAGTRRGA